MRQPEDRTIRLRGTALNHQWAMEMMQERQVHHRDGKTWAVIEVSTRQAGLFVRIREIYIITITVKPETKIMTNAIEQTKREMYTDLKRFESMVGSTHLFKTFQDSLEAHLEELRKEFVDLTSKTSCAVGVGSGTGQLFVYGSYDAVKAMQGIVIDGEDARRRLAEMTQDRDDCQKRMQALDHAHFNLDQANKVAGEELQRCQTNLRHWRDEAGKLDARVRSFESGDIHQKYLRDRQDLMEAEKLSDSLDERLRDAQAVIGHQEQLIAGQRLAIADLYLAKHRAPKAEEGLQAPAPCANTMTILGAVVDCQQIVSDWAVYGHKAKGAMKKLADVLNGTPELTKAMKSFEKADGCMHSFHPAFPGGEQCIFCGESRE